jgi:hypothetical protein
MTPRKPAPKKPAPKAKPKPKPSPPGSPKASDETFVQAFGKLLRSRKLAVPKGLADAPPEAYASQPASVVEDLSKLPDAELKRFAEQVGGYAKRQADRARSEWERSPLIGELRRRKLKEPSPPTRAAGVSVSLAKPLGKWSDKELLKAAEQWSKLSR